MWSLVVCRLKHANYKYDIYCAYECSQYGPMCCVMSKFNFTAFHFYNNNNNNNNTNNNNNNNN